MFNSSSIARLYANVLHEDIVRLGVREQEIRKGIQTMAHVYRPEPTSLQLDSVNVANFNEIGLRCAYLHKCAAFHTALVLDVMNQILENHGPLFKKLVTTEQFKLCCLGGGPGSDAIGIFAALHLTFGIFKKEVVIIDIMENWKFTFDSLIQHILYGDYAIKENFARGCFQWNYIGFNLLDSMSSFANTAISNANFISMVKFVSAAACHNTESMVTKIFEAMKPGALVLFIDNAAGGFHQLVNRAAKQVGLVTKFGPLRHHKYTNEELRFIRFGYTSCFTTTVTIHLLQKPHRNQQPRIHNSSPPQNANAPTFIFNKPPPTRNDFSNSKLHSPQNRVSPGMNTNLNELNLNNKLPKTPQNQGLASRTRTNNQASYSYIPSEPVSPIYNESIYNRSYKNTSNYNVSSRLSAQSEPDAFHESSNNADDGCCSCCVIS